MGRSIFAAILLLLVGTAPAFASFGAIAYDQATGRYGFAWSEATQQRANERALRDCGSPNCHTFPVPPGQCGALAISSTPKETDVWGGAYRDVKGDAEAAAIRDCKKHTKGECKIAGSECNH